MSLRSYLSQEPSIMLSRVYVDDDNLIIKRNVIQCMGGWRKLHHEELHNIYSPRNIIRLNKSRSMTWLGHVPRMAENKFL
jgi:hypothetical protein